MSLWAVAPGDIQACDASDVDSIFFSPSPSFSVKDAPQLLMPFESLLVQQGPVEAGGKSLDFTTDALFYTGGLVWAVDYAPMQPGAPPEAHTDVLAVAVHPSGITRNSIGVPLQGVGAVQLWGLPNTCASPACPSGKPELLAALLHDGQVTWDVKWCPDPRCFLPDAAATTLCVVVPPSSQEQQQQEGQEQQPPRPKPNKLKKDTQNDTNLDSWSGGSCHGTVRSPIPGVLGVLAMITGDGCVHVVSVPELSILRMHVSSVAADLAAGASCSAPLPASSAPQQPPPPSAAPGASESSSCASIRLKPKVLITREMLGGSMASTLEWQHSGGLAEERVACSSGSASTKLLVGCWDGYLAMFRIPGSSLQRLQALFCIRADPLAIWRIVWQAYDPLIQSIDQSQDHSFFTVSHSGNLKVWDDRDMSIPQLEKSMFRSAMHDAVWTTNPAGMMGACEDGSIRQMSFDPQYYVNTHSESVTAILQGQGVGCLWGIAYSPANSVVAYCGEDGILGLLQVDSVRDTRSRKPHAPIGGIVRDGEKLKVLSPNEALRETDVQLYSGGPYYRDKGPQRGKSAADVGTFKDALQCLYTVRFSPNLPCMSAPTHATKPSSLGGSCPAVWLAYGGAAGLVRLQRIGVSFAKQV